MTVVLAVVLGLSSSLCWGTADFLAGLQSRRTTVAAVILGSQLTGLAAVVVALALIGGAGLAGGALVAAVLGGLSGSLALWAFYGALATAPMSIVAPVSAVGVAVPVVVGVASGDRPSALQFAGIAAAFVGVVLASREAGDEAAQARTRTGIGLALLAALGFGGFFVGVGHAAQDSVLWTLLVARSSSVVLLAVIFAARRAPIQARSADVPVLVAVGVLDVGANGLYALATTHGLLSLVAVLGSLYPLMTVALARSVLGERVARVQGAGVLAALIGVTLIAAG